MQVADTSTIASGKNYLQEAVWSLMGGRHDIDFPETGTVDGMTIYWPQEVDTVDRNGTISQEHFTAVRNSGLLQ